MLKANLISIPPPAVPMPRCPHMKEAEETTLGKIVRRRRCCREQKVDEVRKLVCNFVGHQNPSPSHPPTPPTLARRPGPAGILKARTPKRSRDAHAQLRNLPSPLPPFFPDPAAREPEFFFTLQFCIRLSITTHRFIPWGWGSSSLSTRTTMRLLCRARTASVFLPLPCTT